MARPTKIGLDYFPLDVDFFEDEKLEAISGEFGIKGQLTAIKLLCTIYRQGYFTRWNELTKMKLLNSLPSISSELLENIVSRLVRWGFFDESLFNSDKILTSIGIQKRYAEATKRRGKTEINSYCLLDVCINYTSNVVNVDNNTQSKVKESKVKESKVKDDFSISEKLNSCSEEVIKALESIGMTKPMPYQPNVLNSPRMDFLDMVIDCLNDEEWKGMLRKRHPPLGAGGKLGKKFLEFVDMRTYREALYPSEAKFRIHFENWLRSEIRQERI